MALLDLQTMEREEMTGGGGSVVSLLLCSPSGASVTVCL
ncbi:SapB/AmfS family lanthipeptide [Streptomyces monticola]|uniref:SapB/AmfS family lanthipeptide n=1 Tax=Streptomyces monticola TaxID=2666263 RepID=A0ABW2JRE8_9ACTN